MVGCGCTYCVCVCVCTTVTVTVVICWALTLPVQVWPAGQQPTTEEEARYWQEWEVEQHLEKFCLVGLV